MIAQVIKYKEFGRLSTRESVLLRDKFKCQYCGNYGDSVDNLIPVCRGGNNDASNLVASCTSCNQEKAGWLPLEYFFVKNNADIKQAFVTCRFCKKMLLRLIGYGQIGSTRFTAKCPHCGTETRPTSLKGRVAYFENACMVDSISLPVNNSITFYLKPIT